MAREAVGSNKGNTGSPAGVTASGSSPDVILEVNTSNITTFGQLQAALQPLLLFWRGRLPQ